MKLREFQAKEIFRQHGIPCPTGHVATTATEASDNAKQLNSAVVIKPQLGVKGRGKVGGIGFADTPAEAHEEAKRLLNMTIKGEAVKRVLVEEKLNIAQELYVAIAVDYASRQPVIILSTEGGVDIEQTAEHSPEAILRVHINILDGLTPQNIDTITDFMGADVADHVATLYKIFRTYDCELVEINPMIRCNDGKLIAADGVLNVDESSVSRQSSLTHYQAIIADDDPIVSEAATLGWTYIDLPGDIGILSSGAGLTMAILDLLTYSGSGAANFLDTAQIDDEGIYQAFDLLKRAKKTNAILVSLFAGLNRCDVMAQGIVNYLTEHPLDIPVVVRLVGNREQEGHDILKAIGIEAFSNLEDALAAVIELSKGSQTA